MNILYLAHRIPYPPNKGDKLRAFWQIEHLSRRHRVWCACFVDDPHDFQHIPKLHNYCADVGTVELKLAFARIRGLMSLVCGRTITEGFYSSCEMASLLDGWQSSIRFDAVVAFSSSMAQYALRIAAPRRILDLCDLDSLKWADYAEHIERKQRKSFHARVLARLYRWESERLAAAELRWIDESDAAVLATEMEIAPLRALVSGRKLQVIGNGVDLPDRDVRCKSTPQVSPSQSTIDNRQSAMAANQLTLGTSTSLVSAPSTIGFVGVMDYLPNVDAVKWFASECWPAIHRRFPMAQFRIVGRGPTPAVRKLGEMPGIHVVGEVTSVADELSHFDVSIAPLRIARGVQNKVLEAMAAAKAVVLTPKAAQGIAATDGRDYLIAESASQIASAVCSLLADSAARFQLGRAARDFVARNRRWEPQLDKLETLLTELHIRSAPAGVHPPITKLPNHHITKSENHSLTVLSDS